MTPTANSPVAPDFLTLTLGLLVYFVGAIERVTRRTRVLVIVLELDRCCLL